MASWVKTLEEAKLELSVPRRLGGPQRQPRRRRVPTSYEGDAGRGLDTSAGARPDAWRLSGAGSRLRA